jgi:two-component system OmpR family response regulator
VSPTDRPLRVVVVDDEPDVCLLLRLQLERVGYEVVGEAKDGEEAVRVCGETQPDAVVLDLLMPNVSGFEAIPRLRRDNPDLVIIAYTAVAGDFVRNEMARLKIPLVLKMANVEPLTAAIEGALGQRDRAS